jgi:endonuclease/exonuclease/phosphatase family metal-dependent hydrolase
MRSRPFSARGSLAPWVAWGLTAIWALWALVRILGLETGSLLVAVIAFTPYMAFSSPIPVIAGAILRVWDATTVAVLAAILLLVAVLPRAFGGPTEPAGSAGPTLRVLAANMRLGKGDAQALVDLVSELDVDVLSVEELTPKLARELDDDGLDALLRHRVLLTGERSQGGGLYSRLELGAGTGVRLPGGFPLIPVPVELAGAPPVEVASVHTSPPTSGLWDEDLAAVPGATASPLRILIGDFNATLDHDDFRAVVDRGYDDAAATLGDGLTATWPVGRRVLPPLFAIDHVLADERIGIREFSAHDIPHSDHRAVFAELQLPAG